MKNAVFITGAGQRIGYYLVKKFLQENEFPVVFSYRTHHAQVDELISLGATGIQCDFTQNNDLTNLVSHLKQQFTSLRAIIHNASLWLDDQQAPPMSPAYYSMFQVHVDAPLFLNEALLPLLQKSDGLRDIISISDASVEGANNKTLAYLASKAALQNMSKNYAKKVAPDIKVNDIAPGLILFNEEDSEDYKRRRLAQSAIGIEPGEAVIWQAVSYLMSSPYTTGISLPLEGGRHLK